MEFLLNYFDEIFHITFTILLDVKFKAAARAILREDGKDPS
jgi:hypothetical protein